MSKVVVSEEQMKLFLQFQAFIQAQEGEATEANKAIKVKKTNDATVRLEGNKIIFEVSVDAAALGKSTSGHDVIASFSNGKYPLPVKFDGDKLVILEGFGSWKEASHSLTIRVSRLNH